MMLDMMQQSRNFNLIVLKCLIKLTSEMMIFAKNYLYCFLVTNTSNQENYFEFPLAPDLAEIEWLPLET